MTRACCCGTARIALAMTMTTTKNNASVTIPEPIRIASCMISARRALELLRSVGAAIGEDQHRAAHGRDVHGLGLRNAGRRKLRVPRAASVGNPRGTIRTPALDLHHLPVFEPLRARRSGGKSRFS